MPDSLSADLPAPNESDWIAPDCRGQNFYDIDHAMRSLLDELSRMADRHDPVLHARDAFGRDRGCVEFHPAYREMEQIGFGDFGIHCMSRRRGVLGWPNSSICGNAACIA